MFSRKEEISLLRKELFDCRNQIESLEFNVKKLIFITKNPSKYIITQEVGIYFILDVDVCLHDFKSSELSWFCKVFNKDTKEIKWIKESELQKA